MGVDQLELNGFTNTGQTQYTAPNRRSCYEAPLKNLVIAGNLKMIPAPKRWFTDPVIP